MSEASPDGLAAVIWVVAVALIRPDGRILMQRRRRDRVYGGLWEFPGGKIEPGETPGAAARREIAEELGVTLDPSALHPVSFAASAPIPTARPHVILLYAGHGWQGDVRCLDAAETAWFSAGQLEHLAMPPLDYPLARALIKSLTQVPPAPPQIDIYTKMR